MSQKVKEEGLVVKEVKEEGLVVAGADTGVSFETEPDKDHIIGDNERNLHH